MENRKMAEIKASQDQAFLESTALTSKNSTHRRAAASRLVNQRVLECVARKDKNWRVRIAAVKRLANREVLAWVIKNDPEGLVGYWACKRYLHLVQELSDQAQLEEVASAEGVLPVGIRELAVSRLQSQETLAMLAAKDRDGRVRAAATRRLEDFGPLAEVLLLETDVWARRAAAERGETLINAVSGSGCQ